MNTIELNLNVNISLNEDVKKFLTGLFGGNAIQQDANEQDAPKPAAAPKQDEAGDASYTIDEVRALLMQKVNDNRVAIKEKLTELGAKSVTTLDPAMYSDFMDFLNNL